MTAIDCTRYPVDAALWLARSFVDGRRLSVRAPGCEDHAHHIAVEFVHPVVAGTRPLPVLALEEAMPDAPGDVRLVVGTEVDGIEAQLVIPGDQPDVDIVRTYHLLWEMVQVVLEHPGVVGGEGAVGGDSTGFLYPFLDGAETDQTGLNEALTTSVDAKVKASEQLVARTVAANAEALERVAQIVTDAATSGGRVHVMGNGGSATDATRLVRLLRRVGVASVSLSSDYAIVTALANDIGVDHVFARQVEALARPGDGLVGCSTSGTSPNLLAAFGAADARDLVTVGISGYGGETFAAEPTVHHHLDVESPSVHRIQEAQAALMAELCAAIARRRGITEGTAP